MDQVCIFNHHDLTHNRKSIKLAHHKYALNHFITSLKSGTGDQYWELQSMLGDIKNYMMKSLHYVFKPSTTTTSQTTQINSISSFDTDYRTMLEISNEFINLRNYYTK